MTWDFDRNGNALLDRVTEGICAGKSVLIDAVGYLGNGRYEKENKRGRYKYKLFVPIMDKHGRLYSTDLFSGGSGNAVKGNYGIYYCTRQLVVDVIEDFEADYRDERFEFGYRKGDNDRYGQFKVVTEPDDSTTGVDLGENAECNICNRRYCTCPKRQSDGGWKK